MLTSLAQQAAQKNIVQVVTLIGVLIVLVVLAGLAAILIRKRMLANDDSSGISGSIFDDLKSMRDRAQISQEEYDYLRKSIAAKAAGKPPPPRPPGIAEPHELRAKPGYDLTGQPLPPEVLAAIHQRQNPS